MGSASKSAIQELLDRSQLEHAQTLIDVLEVDLSPSTHRPLSVWEQALDDTAISPFLTVVAFPLISGSKLTSLSIPSLLRLESCAHLTSLLPD